MRSFNKAVLLGVCGKDPEGKTLSNGNPVANFSLATSVSWKNNNGEWQEKTQWHRVVSYKGVAEFVIKNLSKGSKVMIEGSIEYREWEDQNGNKRNTTEIVASNIIPLDKKKSNNEDQSNGYPEEEAPF